MQISEEVRQAILGFLQELEAELKCSDYHCESEYRRLDSLLTILESGHDPLTEKSEELTHSS